MNNIKRKKVCIFTATAGAGHLMAAVALKETYEILLPSWDVKVVDVLDYTNKLFKKNYSQNYIKVVDTLPELWGIIYDRTDRPSIVRKVSAIRSFMNSINAHDFIKLIGENPPDLAICTHFLPAEILSKLKRKGKIKFPFACVITDFESHMFWIFENTDVYFVSTPLTKFQLERNKIDSSKVHITGIPIKPVFSEDKPKEELIKKLDLHNSLRTILVMGGGFGMGPVETILNKLYAIDQEFQIVVIAGKNKDLQQKLEEKKHLKPTKIFGFVDNIDELLTVSDLLVSKPGGLTSSEALSKGTPMAILNAIPGQESRNSDYLLENGTAISIGNIEDLGFKISNILKDSSILENMQKNSFKLSKPNAAKEIIDILFSLYPT